MAVNIAALRSQLETALAGRVPAPFSHRPVHVQTAPFNIREIDELTGGLPVGGLTEIAGPSSSGHVTLLLSALASRTAQGHACAIVDGHDTFDPFSAKAAGVKLERLLWVRCRTLDQCLQSTDLLLQSGGFGLIALDVSILPPKIVRYVPLNVWFRFRRAVENTSTIFVLLDQESNAGTCASLVLRLGSTVAQWARSKPKQTHLNSGVCLLNGAQIQIQFFRSRLKSSWPKSEAFAHVNDPSIKVGCEIQTHWSDFKDNETK